MSADWLQMDRDLLLCVLGCAIATVVPKILPITFLNGDALPKGLRKWLEFIPVAVMAALVGSEVFFYDGRFDVSLNNLYLVVSVPLLFIAAFTKNYFVTIAVGMGMIIALRAFGLH